MTTVAVIIIGNEILSGRTQDINLSYLGKRFEELGIQLVEARVVRDVPNEIIDAVNHLRKNFDYVFTTGGIGPTHDDITTECIAAAFDVAVERNPAAENILIDWYGEDKVNDARLKMANIPAGATLVENLVSGAPGYRLDNVYVFAGVPTIMQSMFEGIAHELTGGDPVLTRSVSAHLSESQIASGLDTLQKEFSDISIGSYPFYRNKRFGVSVVSRGTNEEALQNLDQKIRMLVTDLGGKPLEE